MPELPDIKLTPEPWPIHELATPTARQDAKVYWQEKEINANSFSEALGAKLMRLNAETGHDIGDGLKGLYDTLTDWDKFKAVMNKELPNTREVFNGLKSIYQEIKALPADQKGDGAYKLLVGGLATAGVGGKAVSTVGSKFGFIAGKNVNRQIIDSSLIPGPASFMANSDQFFLNASKRADIDIDGYFDVVAHGSAHKIQIETPNGPVLVNHRVAAELIQQQSGYNGQNIRLLSCSTGACDTGFAQNLANKLNVDVRAPSDLYWADTNGNTLVAPKGLNGEPDLSNLGEVRVFQPRNISDL